MLANYSASRPVYAKQGMIIKRLQSNLLNIGRWYNLKQVKIFLQKVADRWGRTAVFWLCRLQSSGFYIQVLLSKMHNLNSLRFIKHFVPHTLRLFSFFLFASCGFLTAMFAELKLLHCLIYWCVLLNCSWTHSQKDNFSNVLLAVKNYTPPLKYLYYLKVRASKLRYC